MASSPDAGALARLRATVRARLHLYPNWQTILLQAWSVRFMVLACGLDGIAYWLSSLTTDPPIEPATLAALSGLATAAAGLSRLFAQPVTLGDDR